MGRASQRLMPVHQNLVRQVQHNRVKQVRQNRVELVNQRRVKVEQLIWKKMLYISEEKLQSSKETFAQFFGRVRIHRCSGL
ncbi:unnamed protein product [Haemonchus placei]|uniref:Uncharacterized protein n=1 Tax=Haemonchus placei TaxID=6290 RepID=A0A3P7ST60_HAEPC|nr:unnamed protein product [Haemonchus placei]